MTTEKNRTELDAWLREAVLGRQEEEIGAALAAGANPNTRFPDYPNKPFVLHLAAQNASPDHMVALIRAGADINAQDDVGNTALHLAVTYGCSKPAQSLLAHGAEVSIASKAGNTPLHMAVSGAADPACISVLLCAGADAHAENDEGYSVIAFAKKLKAKSLITLEYEMDWLRDSISHAALPEGKLDRDSLFDENVAGELTPKNIAFWQHFAEIADRLNEQGEAFSRDDLIWPNEKRPDHLFEQAWRFFRLPQALHKLADEGIYLTPEDLIYENGKPRAFVEEMAQAGALHQLFNADNWQGAKPEAAKACYQTLKQALPEATENQVRNYHQLLASLRASGKALQAGLG